MCAPISNFSAFSQRKMKKGGARQWWKRKQSNAKQNWHWKKKEDSSFISETAFDQHSMCIFVCGNLLRFCFVPTTLLSLLCGCHISDIDMENESAYSHRQIVNQIWHESNRQMWEISKDLKKKYVQSQCGRKNKHKHKSKCYIINKCYITFYTVQFAHSEWLYYWLFHSFIGI